MSADRFSKEMAAYEALARLMVMGQECRSFFEAAHVPVPDRLSRFLGEGGAAEKVKGPRISVPPPESPPRPPEWREGWIWVAATELTPTSLVRALLRGARSQMTPKQIAEGAGAVGVEVNSGSIANIGTRLSESGEIQRQDGAWLLVSKDQAPVLHEGFAWGEPRVFDKGEVASYRRECVVHILKTHPDGLQIVGITKVLEMCDWLHAPLSKDLIKVDVHLLKEDSKVRRGRDGKWRLASE